MDAERAHEMAVDALALLGRLSPVCRFLESLNRISKGVFQPVRVLGLEFPNAVGLAAGFDKNAAAWPAAAALGFGHVEIGTVTALAQPGNPKPRVFRYPGQEAVINRLGFNNQGAAAVAARLSHQAPKGRRPIPLGINIGKSKATEIEKAPEDYLASFSLLADHADYLVLNVSSPNTPGLRQLQDESRLRELLSAVTGANKARAGVPGKTKLPILLKIAPDLTFAQVDAVIGVVGDFGLDGLIATNTTLARPGPFAGVSEAGGLSGRPLTAKSTQVVAYIVRETDGKLPVIGVGGILDVDEAAEKMDAGACLVQVYTGMIYRGPFFPAALARGVADRQRRLR
jgi:dihydroorotate dehydrogenase